ncbi:hypothetical protein M3Y95_00955800 [Aphelenchoides besseyi]|nr:hypothetical protein M3Y95_00955800 [Aphelenchoides besseyi]
MSNQPAAPTASNVIDKDAGAKIESVDKTDAIEQLIRDMYYLREKIDLILGSPLINNKTRRNSTIRVSFLRNIVSSCFQIGLRWCFLVGIACAPYWRDELPDFLSDVKEKCPYCKKERSINNMKLHMETCKKNPDKKENAGKTLCCNCNQWTSTANVAKHRRTCLPQTE